MIHWNPPHDVEEYEQESGRSGRDRVTVAVMYNGRSGGSGDMLSSEMKHYITSSVLCQRELLLGIYPKYPRPVNYIGAAIICARQCQCGYIVQI